MNTRFSQSPCGSVLRQSNRSADWATITTYFLTPWPQYMSPSSPLSIYCASLSLALFFQYNAHQCWLVAACTKTPQLLRWDTRTAHFRSTTMWIVCMFNQNLGYGTKIATVLHFHFHGTFGSSVCGLESKCRYYLEPAAPSR